jgi:hypothetical protein
VLEHAATLSKGKKKTVFGRAGDLLDVRTEILIMCWSETYRNPDLPQVCKMQSGRSTTEPHAPIQREVIDKGTQNN